MADKVAEALYKGTRREGFGRNAGHVKGYGEFTEGVLTDKANLVAQALMAPGNALQGQYNEVEVSPSGAVSPFDTRMVADAATLAGTVGVGGSVVPRPSGSLGMFGGMAAKTADLENLAKAQAMDQNGLGKNLIWEATGWFKGEDGKWRFEIDDSQAAILPAYKQAESFQDIPMQQAVAHDALYAAYPELAQYNAQHRPFPAAAPVGTYGAFVKGRDAVVMNSDAAPFNNAAKLRSNMLHELQHAVQRAEGFEGGTNLDAGMKGYKANLGEREARAVQMRSKLTPAQRRRILPNF